MLTLNQAWVHGDVVLGPHKKPIIRLHTIRTGYRGDIRARWWVVFAFGYVEPASSLQEAFEILAEIYRCEAKRYGN